MGAISMTDIKVRLENLKKYMPGEDVTVYEFGKLLAGRLNPELLPVGFNLAVELLISDIRRGIDGYTGQPIKGHIVGQPTVFYAALYLKIPEIIKAVCPMIFADEVIEIRAMIHKGGRSYDKR